MFLYTVGNHLPDHTVSHCKTVQSVYHNEKLVSHMFSVTAPFTVIGEKYKLWTPHTSFFSFPTSPRPTRGAKYSLEHEEPKILTALIPESCCESCITTPMMRGDRSVGEQISCSMDMVASACCARSSALISSMSSSTWFDARSLRNAATHTDATT